MSFLGERKNEIISSQYKSACCRRAFIHGVLFVKGTVVDGSIEIRLENGEIAQHVANLISEFYSTKATVSTAKNGGRGRIVTFTSTSLKHYLEGLNSGADFCTPGCEFCVPSFLRGVFLACGRVTDPTKQYRLELAPSQNADKLNVILNTLEINLSFTKRRGENILYTNNSVIIEDFFAKLLMNKTAFIYMNEKIKSEFSASVRRLSVCETNNIEKSVDASARQCRAVEMIISQNMLSSLPDELVLTAQMRIKYPDYSLARLASEFTPPISKPGLAHRLNRLIEIAENIKS